MSEETARRKMLRQSAAALRVRASSNEQVAAVLSGLERSLPAELATLVHKHVTSGELSRRVHLAREEAARYGVEAVDVDTGAVANLLVQYTGELTRIIRQRLEKLQADTNFDLGRAAGIDDLLETEPAADGAQEA